jgi:hypothetical protein
MARKAIRKNIPSIPTAPLAERPPDLNIPDDLFEGCSSIETYSSRPFKELDDFESYAKDLYKTVRKNGKGEILFQSEKKFLTELDNALLHFEMFRPIHTPEMSGTFKEQREYFMKLKEALQIKKPSSKLKKVQGRLKERTESDDRRLSKAKFNIAVLKRIETASLDPEQSPDKDLIKDLDQLNVAVDIVRSDLEGKNSGQHLELYLLIEQLGDMYKTCSKSNKTPSITESDYPDKKGRGVFFDLVTSIIQKVFNKKVAHESWDDDENSIKLHTILEGIRFLK